MTMVNLMIGNEQISVKPEDILVVRITKGFLGFGACLKIKTRFAGTIVLRNMQLIIAAIDELKNKKIVD